MDQSTSKSELAQLMQQIDEQNAAGRLGLYGPAIVATHASITARMERGAERILGLIEQGKHKEVETLMNTDYWEPSDEAESATRNEATRHENACP